MRMPTAGMLKKDTSGRAMEYRSAGRFPPPYGSMARIVKNDRLAAVMCCCHGLLQVLALR
jgi:hypothetical protein